MLTSSTWVARCSSSRLPSLANSGTFASRSTFGSATSVTLQQRRFSAATSVLVHDEGDATGKEQSDEQEAAETRAQGSQHAAEKSGAGPLFREGSRDRFGSTGSGWGVVDRWVRRGNPAS